MATPRFVRAPAAEFAPVPPFATGTLPVSSVAALMLPVVRLPEASVRTFEFAVNCVAIVPFRTGFVNVGLLNVALLRIGLQNVPPVSPLPVRFRLSARSMVGLPPTPLPFVTSMAKFVPRMVREA